MAVGRTAFALGMAAAIGSGLRLRRSITAFGGTAIGVAIMAVGAGIGAATGIVVDLIKLFLTKTKQRESEVSVWRKSRNWSWGDHMAFNNRILAALCAAAMFCGFSNSAQASCITSYKYIYEAGGGNKAFAMSEKRTVLKDRDNDKPYACGFSIKDPSLSLAKDKAMLMCQSSLARQDIKGRCRIVDSE